MRLAQDGRRGLLGVIVVNGGMRPVACAHQAGQLPRYPSPIERRISPQRQALTRLVVDHLTVCINEKI